MCTRVHVFMCVLFCETVHNAYMHVYIQMSLSQTNTFQCVLATTVTESFVMFLYGDGRIQWTTGSDSGGIGGLGGVEAVAGINAGDGNKSITIPGSQTPSIINIAETSNVGIPGIWMFATGGTVTCIHTYVHVAMHVF